MLTETLSIELGDRSYSIHVGSGLLDDAALINRYLLGRQVAVVTNETVAPFYLGQVRTALSDRDVECIVLPDGEKYKDIAHWSSVIDRLVDARFNRDATLIALGGGVIGDLTGFVASTYMRGIGFLQLPTTLLAQVDASVGGKTAVNHASGKNLIGAFHQPRAVLIDLETLGTLPRREFKAGMAEVIKCALLGDAPFFDWLEEHAEALMAQDPVLLREAVVRACQKKAAIVARDETEQGDRALLNLGHTFAHAIETATEYEEYLHGEAVAMGLRLAARLSEQLRRAPQGLEQRVIALLQRFELPVSPPAGADAATLVDLMINDKKTLSGKLRFILLEDVGRAFIAGDVAPADAQHALIAAAP